MIPKRIGSIFLTLLFLLILPEAVLGGYTSKQISILKEGAAKNDYACLHNLAVAYFYGDGVSQNNDLAISYGIRAYKQNPSNAIKLLIASAYWANGDFNNAQKWAQEANGGAAYIEGEIYFKGKGRDRNLFMALFNYCHNAEIASKYYRKDLAFHQLRISQILSDIVSDYAKGYSTQIAGLLSALSFRLAANASEGLELLGSSEGNVGLKGEATAALNATKVAVGHYDVDNIKLHALQLNYTDSESKGYYVGEYSDNKKSGFGLLFDSDGSYKIGWLIDGSLNGEGIRRSEHEIQAGTFKDGRLLDGRVWVSRDDGFHPLAIYENGKYLRPVKLLSSGETTKKGGKIANAIDLGLSVRWADSAVGLNGSNDYLFGWGCTNPQLTFQCQDAQSSPYKYLPPNACYAIYGGNVMNPKRNISNSNFDASSILWNSYWQLPTEEQIEELISKCSFRRQGNEIVVTGPNGKSITMPASGIRTPEGLQSGIGGFWSSEAEEESWSTENKQCAWGVLIDPESNKKLTKKPFLKETGLMVWPVADPEAE